MAQQPQPAQGGPGAQMAPHPPRARPIQTNFTAGEVSPRLLGRVDLEQFGNGAAELLNFVVLPQGGATRRSGSQFVAEQKDMTKRVRLLPFRISSRVAYVMEIGEGYIRFHRNRGPVLDAGGDPIELTTDYLESELRALRHAQSVDVLYLTHVNHQPVKISRVIA